MKKFQIFSLVATLVFATFIHAETKRDFSGVWVLDVANSTPPPQGPGGKQPPMGKGDGPATGQAAMRARQMVIKQTDQQLTIERSPRDSVVYLLDGNESMNSMPNGGQVMTRMTWVGETLVAKSTSTLGQKPIETTEERSLDASGKVMTVKITRPKPRGEMMTQTMIFNKQ